MRLRDATASALESLRRRKLRTFLTMLGVIFGVAAVIAMMSIGAGAREEALAIVESMGLRNVIVRAKDAKEDDLREIREKSLGLSHRDARAILATIPQVEEVVASRTLDVQVVAGPGGRGAVPVVGVSPGHRRLAAIELESGVFFDEEDDAAYAQVCVLGQRARRELFGFDPAVGGEVKIDDVWFTVIGVVAERSFADAEFEGVAIEDPSSRVYVPIRTATAKFARDELDDELDEIVVAAREDVDPRRVAELLGALFEDLHGGAEDTTLVVPLALLEQSQRTQRIFNTVMACIASISLLVGGIGIMNIMLASVLERTREIGLRRAVGARQADVKRQFLLEALALSLCGGLAGIALGALIARGVALGAGWTTAVTGSSVLLAFGVCSAIGLVFGYYPAAQAARLDPIEALRHE